MSSIIFYHQETKHYPNRFARGPGYLDWANQPNPFRFWEGTERIELPFIKDKNVDYKALYDYRIVETAPFSLESISSFLELALGLSAWKAIPGSRWAVRMNPSSGNLHPTEGYIIVPDIDGISGVFHYNPYLHALEKRAEVPKELAKKIKDFFGTEGFLMILTSILWREAWKYGERAYRYCLLDTGHAIGSIRFSASIKGWKVKYLNVLSDEDLNALLGFEKVNWEEGEGEYPELALFIFPKEKEDIKRTLPEEIIDEFRKLEFKGVPNVLSKERVIWDLVYKAEEWTRKERTEEERYSYPYKEPIFIAPPVLSAEETIRKRRSGMAYDGMTYISKELFIHALDKTLPRNDYSPFDVEITPVYIDLFIFVHRVHGLIPGLYALVRNKRHLEIYKERLSSKFLWKRADERVPLYLLIEGDGREIASYISCVQEIAGDSSFSLGMISEFESVVKERPYLYRNIHWEAGLIGQVLYLEATSHGFNGTGIGCFFDDLMHEVLEIKDRSFQDVYHFTFGRAVEDRRIQTIDPYYHLKRRQDVLKKA